MSKKWVNEATAMNVRARFYGPGDVLTVPSSIRYRIKDTTNNRIVRDWTDLSVSAIVTIEIPASDNLIFADRPTKRFEDRVVTVQANYGEDGQYTEEIPYMVKNLRGFDS